MSIEASVTLAWSDLVRILLAGWVIGPLTEMAIGGLTGGLTDIPVDMLTEVCIAMVVVVVST